MSVHYNKRKIISSQLSKNVLGVKQYNYFTVCSPRKNTRVSAMFRGFFLQNKKKINNNTVELLY